MTQKLSVNGFEWVEETLEIIECFVISYNEEVRKDIFLKVIFNTLRNCMTCKIISHNCLKKWKIKKSKNTLADLQDKK